MLVSSNAVFVLGDITHVGESNSADLSSVSSYFTKILADQRAPQESVNSYLHDKYWRCHKMLSKSLDWGSLCEEKGIVANHIDKYIASYLEYVDSMGSLSNDSIV